MEKRTKGQVEAQVSDAIIKFEKEYMGRGPMEAKSYVIADMVMVRLKGVLTPAEEQLAAIAEGADLIKRTRVMLLQGAKLMLEDMVAGITGIPVKSLHTDISTRTGERIIIFVLDKNLEERFE